MEISDERRDLLKIATSNREMYDNNHVIEPSVLFQEIANRFNLFNGALDQTIPRTWDKILDTLAALNSQGLLPDLSTLVAFGHRGDATDPIENGRDDGSVAAE